MPKRRLIRLSPSLLQLDTYSTSFLRHHGHRYRTRCIVVLFIILAVFLTIQYNTWIYTWILLTCTESVSESSIKVNVFDMILEPHSNQERVWPDSAVLDDDRIIAQNHYVPPTAKTFSNHTKTKKIFINNVDSGFIYKIPEGKEGFHQQNCLVNSCRITYNHLEADSSDAILFVVTGTAHAPPITVNVKRRRQIWIMFTLQPPTFTPDLSIYNNLINWTMTYRTDSTIVVPYGKYVHYPYTVETSERDYAASKTKEAAIIISNCKDNQRTLEYIAMLRRFLNIDVFGECGNIECTKHKMADCLKVIQRDYMFYLAFEKATCIDYISEKLFRNANLHDTVPVVMGATIETYQKLAPPGSYIHVSQFPSPQHLAEYLHKVERNHTLYNEFFKWRETGRVFYKPSYLCRLCAMLHDNTTGMWYPDVQQWWNGDGVCQK